MAKEWDLDALGIDPEDLDEDGNGDAFVMMQSIDASDVMATLLTREYPLLQLERVKVLPWRYAWTIVIPEGAGYDVTAVDKLAHKVSQRLYWEKDELIGYSVTITS